MNFLSHFYFTQNKNDPYLTLGTILPDLLRNYNKSWKINLKKEGFPNKGPEQESLLRGWELHLQVDKAFHSSSLFFENSSLLRKELVQIFTALPIRPFFLAHVGYELVLDSLLLQNGSINSSVFYQYLQSCDPRVINDFLSYCGLQEHIGFHGFLNSFIQSRYLESYMASKSLVYALDQIGQRVWTQKFDEQQAEQAERIIENFRLYLSPNFMKVFHQVELELT